MNSILSWKNIVALYCDEIQFVFNQQRMARILYKAANIFRLSRGPYKGAADRNISEVAKHMLQLLLDTLLACEIISSTVLFCVFTVC